MNPTKKDNRISRNRSLDCVVTGLIAIISALGRWPARVRCATAMVVAVVLILLLVPTVYAASELEPPLDCQACHTQELSLHDKLGSGNQACWSCHDAVDMGKLHLADGSQLSLSDSTQLCGQCHQERYKAWTEGTHGISGTVAAVKCTGCHDPHQPQIALLDITKPHPAPQPAPDAPTVELLVMFGTVGLLVVIVMAAVTQRGGRP